VFRVNSLKDYLENKQLKLYVEKDSLNLYHMNSAQESVIKDAWQAIQSGKRGIVSVLKAIDLVENDLITFFMDINVVLKSYEYDCTIHKECFDKLHISLNILVFHIANDIIILLLLVDM